MQAIIDACKSGALKAKPVVVISNNSNSGAIERAKKEEIPVFYLSGKTHPYADALDQAILDTLVRYKVDVVALAGYMKKLGPKTLSHFHGRVLNIHPALLPKFGGAGMWGIHVHEAVIASGEKESGVTIHFVDENYDTGRIIAQTRVPVMPGDTPETLATRVLEQEHKLYPATLQRIVTGDICFPAD